MYKPLNNKGLYAMELFLVNFPHKSLKMLQKCTKSAFPLFVNSSLPFLYAAVSYIKVVFHLTEEKKRQKIVASPAYQSWTRFLLFPSSFHV